MTFLNFNFLFFILFFPYFIFFPSTRFFSFFIPPHLSLISHLHFLFFRFICSTSSTALSSYFHFSFFFSSPFLLQYFVWSSIFDLHFSFFFSSLALRLLQSIQEAPLHFLLPPKLKWVSFALFFSFIFFFFLF